MSDLDVDALLDDRGVRVLLCCGSGGVGKTTISAALALRAAERGRRVVVLTIDPARRLAQALGIGDLDHAPRPVAGVDPSAGGSLEAMMLDMKRTFDEVVEAHATPEVAAQILANPFYVSLSSSFAGTQEYMAMERLGQLRAAAASGEAPWDLLVVDTPPSRSALDVLDAPARLSGFLDGRLVRLLTAPAKVGGRASRRVIGAGMGLAGGVMSRLLGGQMLTDVQTFVAAMETVFGGFRARAEATYAMLQLPETAFLVVSSPEAAPLAEADHLLARLAAERLPVGGVVVNRMSTPAHRLGGARALRAAAQLEATGERLGPELLRVHADLAEAAARDRAAVRGLRQAHPGVPVGTVSLRGADVHDLDGLRAVGALLAGR